MSGSNPLLPTELFGEETLTDEYIYQLILQDAEQAKQRANEIGVLGYLSKYKEPVSRGNIPNKRFLQNVVKNNINFNKNEVERRERDRKKQIDYDDHRDRRRDSSKYDSQNNSGKRSTKRKWSNDERSYDSEEIVKEPLIGPKIINKDDNRILIKNKARGRGSVGSNRLDQYFSQSNEENKKQDLETSPPIQLKKIKKEKKYKKEKKSKKEKKT